MDPDGVNLFTLEASLNNLLRGWSFLPSSRGCSRGEGVKKFKPPKSKSSAESKGWPLNFLKQKDMFIAMV